MAFPAGLQTVTVTTGPHLAADGNPLAGVTVILTPEWPLIHEASGSQIHATSVRLVTDALGTASGVVTASDAAGLRRTNFTWLVSYDFGYAGPTLPAFRAFLPAATPTVDLELIAASDPSGSLPVVMPAVTSVAGKTGAVVLTASDVSGTFTDNQIPSSIARNTEVGALAAASAEVRAAFLPRWAPNTAYAQGDTVLSPAGATVSANAAFTSGSTYSASNWTVTSGGTVPDATSLAKGKSALNGDLGGTADKPVLRTQTRNERSATPVLTKLDLTIGTLAAVGLATVYLPWLIRVPDAVFAAFPQYGRWRVYTSTDHDEGDGGIAIGVCGSDDVETAANWSWLRNAGSPVMFKDGTNRQTETPCVVWNPATALFHMYYQVAVGTTQTTRVATSANGVTGWTIVGDAIPNLPNTVAGWNHTGYARVYYLDGLWAAWHLQGTGATSSYGWSFSKDGFAWITDRRRVGAAVHMTDGVLRLGISTLVKFRGDLWAIGFWSEYVSGATGSATVPVWAAPISLASDLRQLLTRPQRVALDGGCPPSFATHPDGRLFGATREGGATGSLKLAVLA